MEAGCVKRVLLACVAGLALGGCAREAEEAEEAPAVAVDVTQEAQRVREGMTEAEVVAILGEPRNRVKERSGDRLTFWSFDEEQRVKARVYVSLDSAGKVVNVETIPL